ncbi:MAG TPA: transglycosylase SLT domain-containing protein [Pyrinomonadaceae bacterium]|nr:transglycosylase SLT domain-containing protein [Pyrinomonadaceae bacterium]
MKISTSFPRLVSHAAFLFALVVCGLNVQAQHPSVSALRDTPNEVEREDPRVQKIIDRAEGSFKTGLLNLKDNRVEQARDDFDRAVDAILESGVDVRSNPRLNKYYSELVQRVYLYEVPQQHQAAAQAADSQVALDGGQPPAAGQPDASAAVAVAQIPTTSLLKEQKFEPSPLDELSKLVLTEEEKQVAPEKVAELEEEINTLDLRFKSNALIQQFINYYQGRGRSTMESGLRRSGQFMTMSRHIFREEGVPEDIVWLGQVESAWRPTACSWAAACGLWQFIPGTGAMYGLRKNGWVDERLTFEKATRASARHLRDLAKHYNGNWELALAAYNTGAGNVDRAIRRTGKADFWTIYPYIAQETRNYVPNILATILIAKNPEKYGFGGVQRMTPVEKVTDVVSVPSSTSLQLIANLTETSLDQIQSLNPAIRRGVTPPGESYHVLVPAGRGKQLVSLLKRIPASQRNMLARTVTVSPGEDLSAVAARTGTSVAALQQLNQGVDLSKGGRIIVPSGNSRIQLTSNRRGSAVTGSNLVAVRAKAGETVAQIAARNNVSAEDVARLNTVSVNEPLAAGRVINIPSRGAVQPSTRPAARRQ